MENTHNNANVFGQKDTTSVETFSQMDTPEFIHSRCPDRMEYAYAVKAAKKIIEQEHIYIDLFFFIHPHSLQLIAQKIAKQNNE